MQELMSFISRPEERVWYKNMNDTGVTSSRHALSLSQSIPDLKLISHSDGQTVVTTCDSRADVIKAQRDEWQGDNDRKNVARSWLWCEEKPELTHFGPVSAIRRRQRSDAVDLFLIFTETEHNIVTMSPGAASLSSLRCATNT